MKEKSLRFRLSERRYKKLKLYAESKEKTMTQLIEDWIDRLPAPEKRILQVPCNCILKNILPSMQTKTP